MNTNQSLKRLDASLVEQFKLATSNKNASNANKQIVHLGIGAFHRAHQAVYTEKANQLTSDNIHSKKMVFEPNVQSDIPYYKLNEQLVWGATATILAEFQAILEKLPLK